MKTKQLLTALLATAMIGSLAACGGGGKTTTPAPGAVTTPGTGVQTMPNGDVLDADQTFTAYITSEPATLDSGKANDIYSNNVFINVMEPLTRIEMVDGKDVMTAAGATEWEPNADGTIWTFHLRENMWSDGVPVKAQDYAYGIIRTLDPATGSPNSFFIPCIKNAEQVLAGKLPVDQLGVKAIDDMTLEITLENPTPYFLSLTYTRAMYPLRQDIVEKSGDTYGAELDTLVFNGPFVLSAWVHNSELTMTKNESYWDKDNVKLQTINYKINSDLNAVYNSFDNGSFDIVNVADQEWKTRFAAKDDVTFYNYANPAIRFNIYNTKEGIFSNLNMRKAFTLAVNREEVAKTIFQDTMIPSYSWVPEGVSTGELGEFTYEGNTPLKTLVEENADAKALLLKGMEELGLGTDPAALKITCSFGNTSQLVRNYGEYLQQIVKTVLGVNIELDYSEWATFQSKTNAGDYQMGYMQWSIDYNDPMGMLGLMISGTNNLPTFWSNAEFDNLMAQAAVEVDEAKRVEIYKKAETILMHDDAVISPIVNEITNRFVYNHVKNMPATYFSDYVGGLKSVYISGKQ